MNNADQPAFPVEDVQENYKGLTKREYFAAMALQGICTSIYDFSDHSKTISQDAIKIANELLQQLEITKPKS